MLEESNADMPNAYKLLSKGPYVPNRRRVPFQTKIQRYYPCTKEVPLAGKTTYEISKTKESSGHRRLQPPNKLRSLTTHFDGIDTNENMLYLGGRRHFIDQCVQGQQLQTLLDTNLENQSFVETRRPIMRMSSAAPAERSSLQAQTLIQSQYPPFAGISNISNTRVANKFNTAAGIQQLKKEELIEAPKVITYCVKKPGAQRNTQEMQTVLEQQSLPLSNNEKEKRHRNKLNNERGISINKKKFENVGNVFEYQLPRRRTMVYTGCIESRTGPDRYKASEHSVEANGLFIVPKKTANVHDTERPIKQMITPLHRDRIGFDMLPDKSAGDDFLDSRPTKSIETLKMKCRDYISDFQKRAYDPLEEKELRISRLIKRPVASSALADNLWNVISPGTENTSTGLSTNSNNLSRKLFPTRPSTAALTLEQRSLLTPPPRLDRLYADKTRRHTPFV